MSMRRGGAPPAGGANLRKGVAYVTVGLWSSSLVVAGLLFYLLGPRRHHVVLGVVVGAIYLVVTGAVNWIYLRGMRRQLAERLGAGPGPSGSGNR
ncbi:MAG TPA: hypothetical protein VKA05_02465 [Acidimicrobiales bacterium]|nr:hypothetical protein [Acidimicrobiales bacterium]